MTFRSLLISKAAVCLVFGLLLLLAPRALLGLLGADLSAGGVFTAREYGAALIGTLLLTWFAREVKAFDARRAILLDLLVYDAIGAIITLLVVISTVLNALGWAIVGVYTVFAVASAYLLIEERRFQGSELAGRA